MKKVKYIGLALVLIASLTIVGAQPKLIAATVVPSGNVVFIPETAIELTPGVFSLGTALDTNGRIVEGFLITKEYANNRPIIENSHLTGGSCFAVLSKGARWKTTEDYIIASDIDSALTSASLDAWDSEVLFNIFGNEISGIVDGADSISPDGKNEVMFNNLGASSTVAYTIIWGIFSGPPDQREIVEWDAVFNSAYPWSLTGEAGMMDYMNVAVHEFGHSTGLGHPRDTCVDESMYRFVSFGETKKRTLNTGDINGVNKVYS